MRSQFNCDSRKKEKKSCSAMFFICNYTGDCLFFSVCLRECRDRVHLQFLITDGNIRGADAIFIYVFPCSFFRLFSLVFTHTVLFLHLRRLCYLFIYIFTVSSNRSHYLSFIPTSYHDTRRVSGHFPRIYGLGP